MGVHLDGHLRVTSQWRIGLDVAHDRARLDWQDQRDAETGDWQLALTGARSYLAWLSPTGSRFWGLVGYSGGTLHVTGAVPGMGRQSAPVTHRHAAVGGSLPLGAVDGLGREGVSVRLRGEAWMGTLDVEDNGDLLTGVRRHTAGLRGLLDSEWAYELSETQRLTPSVRLGVQYDEGAGGTGLEAGTEVEWEDLGRGLHGRLAARTLVVEGVVREWGLGGDLSLGAPDGLGPILALRTSRGNLTDGRAQWWDQGLSSAPLGPAAAGLGVNLEAGWGLRGPGDAGVLTPFVGIELTAEAARTLRLGSRLSLDSGLGVAFEGTHQERQGARPEQGVFVQVHLSL